LIDGQSAAATLLMSEKAITLEDVPADRALKLNVEGAGNYRVAYDEASWKLLLATLPGMNVPDQVNLLSDAWAFVQEGRQPLSFTLIWSIDCRRARHLRSANKLSTPSIQSIIFS
jgi:aminopeptidase N